MTHSITIKLPWYPQELSPNDRPNRHKKAAKYKSYKWEAKIITMTHPESSRLPFKGAKDVTMHADFLQKDSRNRDYDNMLASIKAGIDGICEALGFDDGAIMDASQTKRNKCPDGKGSIVITFTLTKK